MTMSPRTRELCFLLIPVLAGLIGLDRGKAVHEDEPRGGKYHHDQSQRG